ncbi:hypothetical protein Q7P37_004251 [Cladosporium fusiforme]
MSRPTAVHRRSAKTEYIETDTGNKISRKAHIEGKPNIMLGGRTVIMAGVTMRGDLQRKAERSADGSESSDKLSNTAITIGRGTIVSTDCVIRPPIRQSRGQMTYYPLRIGDNVFIGPGSHVASLSISSHVHIGAGCVLSPFSIIKENCRILPGTVVPPAMVVPPGSVVAGKPARVIGEVGEGWGQGGGEGEEWVEGGDLRALCRRKMQDPYDSRTMNRKFRKSKHSASGIHVWPVEPVNFGHQFYQETPVGRQKRLYRSKEFAFRWKVLQSAAQISAATSIRNWLVYLCERALDLGSGRDKGLDSIFVAPSPATGKISSSETAAVETCQVAMLRSPSRRATTFYKPSALASRSVFICTHRSGSDEGQASTPQEGQRMGQEIPAAVDAETVVWITIVVLSQVSPFTNWLVMADLRRATLLLSIPVDHWRKGSTAVCLTLIGYYQGHASLTIPSTGHSDDPCTLMRGNEPDYIPRSPALRHQSDRGVKIEALWNIDDINRRIVRELISEAEAEGEVRKFCGQIAEISEWDEQLQGLRCVLVFIEMPPCDPIEMKMKIVSRSLGDPVLDWRGGFSDDEPRLARVDVLVACSFCFRRISATSEISVPLELGRVQLLSPVCDEPVITPPSHAASERRVCPASKKRAGLCADVHWTEDTCGRRDGQESARFSPSLLHFPRPAPNPDT